MPARASTGGSLPKGGPDTGAGIAEKSLSNRGSPSKLRRMKVKIAAFLWFIITGLLALNCPAQDDTTPPPTDRLGGSVHLFNGKDFTGFTFCMRDGGNPLDTWSVTNGVIHCTGK